MNFITKNQKEWSDTLLELFPNGVPTTARWTDLDAIVNVLKKVSSIPSLNHMFYPTGGGNDLTGVSKSNEEGCIELNTDGIFNVIKPKELTFEEITLDNEWSYFRIELEELQPSGIYKSLYYPTEELTELRAGKYVDRNIWDEGEYRGKPLPKSARVVIRFFSGAFVIFKKTSIYNRTGLKDDAYDGKHSKMSADAFRHYIQEAASRKKTLTH